MDVRICCGKSVILLCSCGQNYVCEVCGNGQGATGCACTADAPLWTTDLAHRQLLGESVEEYRRLWERLAGR